MNEILDFYTCIYLTENEHHVVEEDIRTTCIANQCKLVYYRKLRHPKSKEQVHIPMYREFKIQGSLTNINCVIAWMRTSDLDELFERNPHTIMRKDPKKMRDYA